MNDYERGWVEAIIDGEGCLYFSKEKSFRCRLIIANTNRSIIEKFISIVGYGTPNKHKNGSINSKDIFSVSVYNDKLRNLLPQIKLIAKEKQRLLMIEALSLTKNMTGRKGQSSASRLNRLSEIEKEFRLLNHRGRD